MRRVICKITFEDKLNARDFGDAFVALENEGYLIVKNKEFTSELELLICSKEEEE